MRWTLLTYTGILRGMERMSVATRQAVGRRIEVELIDRDWSQGDLAERAKVGEDTISDLINGRTIRPRPRTMRSIEEVFGWPHGTIRGMLDGGPAPARSTRGRDFPQPATFDNFLQRRAAARLAMPDLSDDDFERIFELAERLRQPQTLDPGLEDGRSQQGQQGGAV